MALFSSLVPGIREIRAPLFAGYLWLFCAWLVVNPSLSAQEHNPTLARLVEAAEAVRPVGAAVAGSVAAYLIGSLVQAVFRGAWGSTSRGIGLLRLDEIDEIEFEEFSRDGDRQSLATVVKVANPFRDIRSGEPLANDSGLTRTVGEMADRELMDSFRQLQAAVEAVERRTGPNAMVSLKMDTGTPIVELAVRSEDGPESTDFVIPHFFPVRDLVGQSSLLQTRLIEVAEATGAQIERLEAESEFRFALTPPLVALIGILAVGVSIYWLFALVLPLALVLQGIALRRQATEELFDALRARNQTPELERITPVFARYRSETTSLVDGLRSARWPS